MSVRFRMVGPSVWSSKRFRKLSNDGKLGYLYLLTNRHSTSIGAFELRPLYMADDMDIQGYEVEELLDEIEATGLIERDQEESLIRIDRWFNINPITNPHHMLGTLRAVSALPSSSLQLPVFMELMVSALQHQGTWRNAERISLSFEKALTTLQSLWRDRGDTELLAALDQHDADFRSALEVALSVEFPDG